jgi:serine/threonine-protein kinase
VDSHTFFANLKNSGLLSDQKVSEVSGRHANSAMDIVVADLVDQGLLTRFQVQQLQAGQHKGLVLGQYHLLDEVGRGGYGCVYKARHKLMDRVVALKVIAPERVEDSRARAWFRREVLAATHLTHPNIVVAYDADEIDGVLFLAMEFIDGLDLDTLVRAHGPLPIASACEMLLQTTKALQYAHEQGMVHRDIKPANLLVPREALAQASSPYPATALGTARPVLVKIVDFGLARLHTSSGHSTLVLQNERSFVGTPAYVSPEQARNVHEVDIRSDLYSLGCTFYFALTGRPPFQASSPLQIVVQHLEREPEALEMQRPEIPPGLASVIRRLMAKKPDKRFQTPAELLNELGFFYALDRSGMQRAMPFAGGELRLAPDGHLSDTGMAAHSAARTSEGVAAEESQYAATRESEWDQVRPAPASDSCTDARELTPAVVSQTAEAAVVAPSLTAETTFVAPKAVEADASPPTNHQKLVEHWQAWAGVVANLAAGRPPGLGVAEYRVLQRDLLDACNAPAANEVDLCGRMADLAQPWLTLSTFSAADRETIASLHEQCRTIDARLGVRHAPNHGIAVIIAVAVTIAVCLFLYPLVMGGPGPSWSSLVQRHPLVSLVILAPAAILTAVWLIPRLLRIPRFFSK